MIAFSTLLPSRGIFTLILPVTVRTQPEPEAAIVAS